MSTRIQLLLLIALTAGAVGAQTVTRKTLNGEWTGTLKLDNSSPRMELVFALSDSAFAGKVYADGQLFGQMEDGSLRGDTVHFKAGGLDFTGVVKGVRMAVDLIVYNGSTRKLNLTQTPPMTRDTSATSDAFVRTARERAMPARSASHATPSVPTYSTPPPPRRV